MAVFLLLLFNCIVLISASLDHEFGVDHEKDKHDPSYKYKMRGIKNIQLLTVFKFVEIFNTWPIL